MTPLKTTLLVLFILALVAALLYALFKCFTHQEAWNHFFSRLPDGEEFSLESFGRSKIKENTRCYQVTLQSGSRAGHHMIIMENPVVKDGTYRIIRPPGRKPEDFRFERISS